MYSDNAMLFKQALMDAAIKKYNDELSQCDMDDTVSARYKRVIRQIIKKVQKSETVSIGHRQRWSNKKRVVAVLAAIILLLGGLTVYAKRDAIVSFVEQIFEKFTKVSYQEEPNNETNISDSIEQAYIPAYIPDGFELQDTDRSLTTYQMQWINLDGAKIVFDQGVIGATYYFDNEHSSFETMTVGEYDVYSTHSVWMHTYLWSDESYSYSISIYNTDIPFEEIEKMILSLSELSEKE